VTPFGEIGLDYYYDNDPREVQRAVFVRQMENRPRGRAAHLHSHPRRLGRYLRAFARALDRTGLPGGILHCFTGGPDEARRLSRWDST